MASLDLPSLFLFLTLLLSAAAIVLRSLDLGRKRQIPNRSLFPNRRIRTSRAVGLGRKKIAEYLGRLADEFQPVAEEEKLATSEGSVSIPMAIAVRGELRILMPVDAATTDELMESTLRQVALIRKHRYPDARIVFLSDRPLPVELSLCSHPKNPIGRLLVEMAFLGGLSAPHGQLSFQQIFERCTSRSLSFSFADLDAIDAFLDSELVTGPVTPTLRCLSRLLGQHVEWVLAGIFPDSLSTDDGTLRLAVEGGDLELDLQLLGLETIYGGGRVSIAGLVRDIVAIKADPHHVPTEVNPAILQRFPTSKEVRQHRAAPDLIEALLALGEERRVRLGECVSGEELVSFYRCPCGTLISRKSRCDPESPCRSLSDIEGRLMENLQQLGKKGGERCHYCHGKLTGRDLSLLLLTHPFVELRLDLWVSLHRLASGKFWWRISRLRCDGTLTHYPGVLSPETFRRAFGRFYSVKEGWELLFERVEATLGRQRLRAEKGMVLHAAPGGGRRPPRGVRRRAGFFGRRLLVPILARQPVGSPRSLAEPGAQSDWISSLAPNIPVSAWCEASIRPFMKVFRRTIKGEGGRLLGFGTRLMVRHKNGGESFRDLEQEIERSCRMGLDYLVFARRQALDALRQAGEVGRYLRRSEEALGPLARLHYDPKRERLEITELPEGAATSVSMKGLMERVRPDDGSFDRFLRAAAWHCDLGVGLDVCGCGAKAFVAKKLRSADWPKKHREKLADGGDEVACRLTGPISEIFTRDCGLHSHYLTVPELGKWSLALKDLDARFQHELSMQRFRLRVVPTEVDAHLFLLCSGTDAASIILSGALVRGLVDTIGVPLGRKAVRFRIANRDGLVLGDPEAPRTAFAEAVRLLRRQSAMESAPIRHEGVLSLPKEGAGHFDLE